MSDNRPPLERCKQTGKVKIKTELEAKMILARRVWKDKGERGYVWCIACKQYHFTTKPQTR